MNGLENLIDGLMQREEISLDNIPNIDLYMDQVLTLFDKYFPYNEGEQVLTKTMINNYVKGGLIMPASKKKYSREHILVMIIICMLKRSMSLSEIKSLIDESGDMAEIENVYKKFMENKKDMNIRAKDRMEEIISGFIEDDIITNENKLSSVLILSYYSNLLGEAARMLVKNDSPDR